MLIKNAIIEFMFQDKYLNTIQVNCPHILRYLTAAIIVRRNHDLKDILRVLRQEKDNYSDPITQFLLLLYVEFDFEQIKENLKDCEKVLKNDIFLSRIVSDFLQAARLLVFEAYCRIHHTIKIDTLAELLDIKEDVEQHLVEYIRLAKVNAKLDSSKNQILITPRTTSAYQQVISQTKMLSYRSQTLMANIDKQYALKAD